MLINNNKTLKNLLKYYLVAYLQGKGVRMFNKIVSMCLSATKGK